MPKVYIYEDKGYSFQGLSLPLINGVIKDIYGDHMDNHYI